MLRCHVDMALPAESKGYTACEPRQGALLSSCKNAGCWKHEQHTAWTSETPSGYTSLAAVKSTDLFQFDSLIGPLTLAGAFPAAGAVPERKRRPRLIER